MRAAPARHVLGSALLVFRACLICSHRMPWKWAFRRPGHNGDQAISGQNKQVAPSLRQGQGRMHCGDSVVQCPQEGQRGTCLSYSAPSSDRPLQRIAGPTLHRCDGRVRGKAGPKGRTWVSARVGRKCTQHCMFGASMSPAKEACKRSLLCPYPWQQLPAGETGGKGGSDYRDRAEAFLLLHDRHPEKAELNKKDRPIKLPSKPRDEADHSLQFNATLDCSLDVKQIASTWCLPFPFQVCSP
jgi:hypothetical protein